MPSRICSTFYKIPYTHHEGKISMAMKKEWVSEPEESMEKWMKMKMMWMFEWCRRTIELEHNFKIKTNLFKWLVFEFCVEPKNFLPILFVLIVVIFWRLSMYVNIGGCILKLKATWEENCVVLYIWILFLLRNEKFKFHSGCTKIALDVLENLHFLTIKSKDL